MSTGNDAAPTVAVEADQDMNDCALGTRENASTVPAAGQGVPLGLVQDQSFRPGEIVRAQHDKDHPYLQVSKTLLRDDKLSFEERGFLCFILAKPTDWHSRPDVLAPEAKISRAKVYRLLRRLVEVGYVEREIIIRRDPLGRFQSTTLYTVHETPVPQEAATLRRNVWKRPAGAGVPDERIPF